MFGFWERLTAWTQANRFLVLLVLIAYFVWWLVVDDWRTAPRAAEFRKRTGIETDEGDR